MKYSITLVLLLFFAKLSVAQEFKCQVQVAAQQTGNTQLTVFKTLETALQEFVNETNWTQMDLDNHQQISCNIFINITSFNSNKFSGSIQIQASRPVFGSTMTTPIFNFKDDQFGFTYTEYEPLDYNRNNYTSNLISTISFYMYTILGIDGDTFEMEGGQNYHEEARQIVNTAQQGNQEGWSAKDGRNSRFQLNNDMLTGGFADFRKALYMYHREGMDQFYTDPEAAKGKIVESISLLRQVNNSRPNSILLRTFFDAKADEIKAIFSGGPSVSITEVVSDLNSIAPLHSKKWSEIKY